MTSISLLHVHKCNQLVKRIKGIFVFLRGVIISMHAFIRLLEDLGSNFLLFGEMVPLNIIHYPTKKKKNPHLCNWVSLLNRIVATHFSVILFKPLFTKEEW